MMHPVIATLIVARDATEHPAYETLIAEVDAYLDATIVRRTHRYPRRLLGGARKGPDGTTRGISRVLRSIVRARGLAQWVERR